MKNQLARIIRGTGFAVLPWLAWGLCQSPAKANPTGGTVAQGTASFSTAGSQLTVNTSANAFINWQSFNIGASETTTFVQPSSASVVWNQINDPNPSQILGTLNANGYVILQNQAGFSIGGSAAINAHGLVMTTASSPAPNLAGGGAWTFNAPPPTAKIINYGQINIGGGGSAFLIAGDIENNGAISAPAGKIGLYAGEQVLVSMSPDGRGLSAQVTLPQGSVDNQGQLIADGGSIAAQAQTVNQNGLVQANSVQSVNGVIELVASENLTLGANSDIEAHGDNSAASASPGGFVVLQSGNTYADTPASTINVAGQNAQDGVVEIFGTGPVQASIGNNFATLINPFDLTLTANPTDTTSSSPNFNVNDLANYSQIALHALDNIEVGTLWTLPDAAATTRLNLTAGNNLTVDDGAGIAGGNNWSVNLTAGNTLYLNGTSSIQTQNGDIALLAPALHTLNGANINVTAGSGSLELGSTWTLDDASATASLNLAADSHLNLDAGAGIAAGNNWNVNLTAGTLALNGNASLQAQQGNITLKTSVQQTQAGGDFGVTATEGSIELGSLCTLAGVGTASSLNLTAGNNITFDNNSGIAAGNNWNVNLTAGTALAMDAPPISGSDGIYLKNNASVRTQNGDIRVWAANEVKIATGVSSGNDGMRTLAGGNIEVTTLFGDVNTGGNSQGYSYNDSTKPYYAVSPTLGGISTMAGGNVTITAGGNVTSYDPSGTLAGDAGTGAFGPKAGNVTITAGGNVYGHYVLANGVGTITAGGDAGVSAGNDFALSLVNGTWNVNAPNGNIYLQEVRNPNGVFNNSGSDLSAASHLFDYDPEATVNLTAGLGVYLTGLSQNLPRLTADPVAVILPPILNITAGSGGVTLLDNVALYPSPYQNLTITTTGGGNLTTANPIGTTPELLMSDSSQSQWINGNAALSGITTFSDSDHAATAPVELNPNPVVLNISGSMENLTLITTKETQITVGGDMINCGFSGQNVHSGGVTSITVAGQIYNQNPYTIIPLTQVIPDLPASALLPGMTASWDDIFTLALDPSTIGNLTVPASLPQSQWAAYAIQAAGLFAPSVINGKLQGNNPGFFYDPTTGRLGFAGPITQPVISALGQPTITVLLFGANGLPSTVTKNGQTYFQTQQVTWVPVTSDLTTLFQDCAGQPSPDSQLGYRIGGPGAFDVTAGSISLGSSFGILSCGVEEPPLGGFGRYVNLAPITPSGATLNVTVSGDLDMLTSTIAAIGGGDVNVTSTGGSMDLGSSGLSNQSSSNTQLGYGIYSSGKGDVRVTAQGDINIDGSRIAAFNGGDIFVTSSQGTVNVGSGGETFNSIYVSYVDPATGLAGSYSEDVYGSGIVANTLLDPLQVPGGASVPGNITVETPRGDIIASLGGVTQEALNGNIAGGPTVTLVAGTFGAPGYTGNIDLGESGVIGGTVNVTANGNVTGLVISRQNSTINAAQNFSGTVLSGGAADVSGGGSVSGIIVGVGGASVSGANVSGAEVLGTSVSVNGGAAQNTLGATAGATSASQSAANQSDTQAKQQLASNNGPSDDEKKKKKPLPLIQRLKRVTVILPDKT